MLNSFIAGYPLMASPVSAQEATGVVTYVRSAAVEAGIEIDAGKPSPSRIRRTIFGTILEDIRQSIFDGVSAELLDNPSLESYPASLTTLQQRFSSPDFQRSSARGLPLPWLPFHPDDGWRYEPR